MDIKIPAGMLPYMSAPKGNWREYLETETPAAAEKTTDAEIRDALGRSWDEAAKLMKAAGLLKAYNAEQPRDKQGRWSTTYRGVTLSPTVETAEDLDNYTFRQYGKPNQQYRESRHHWDLDDSRGDSQGDITVYPYKDQKTAQVHLHSDYPNQRGYNLHTPDKGRAILQHLARVYPWADTFVGLRSGKEGEDRGRITFNRQDILRGTAEKMAKFDPDQARDAVGRWTGKARGISLTPHPRTALDIDKQTFTDWPHDWQVKDRKGRTLADISVDLPEYHELHGNAVSSAAGEHLNVNIANSWEHPVTQWSAETEYGPKLSLGIDRVQGALRHLFRAYPHAQTISGLKTANEGDPGHWQVFHRKDVLRGE